MKDRTLTAANNQTAALARVILYPSIGRPPNYGLYGKMPYNTRVVQIRRHSVILSLVAIINPDSALYQHMEELGDGQGLDPLDLGPDLLGRIPQIHRTLRVEPELRRVAKQT